MQVSIGVFQVRESVGLYELYEHTSCITYHQAGLTENML